MSMTADERLANISERVTRMDERQVADAVRIAEMRAEMRAGIEKLDARVSAIENRSAWLTGVLAVLGGLLGWFAKAFTITNSGGKP